MQEHSTQTETQTVVGKLSQQNEAAAVCAERLCAATTAKAFANRENWSTFNVFTMNKRLEGISLSVHVETLMSKTCHRQEAG